MNRSSSIRAGVGLLLCTLAASAAAAVPAPRNLPYPGMLQLDVDVSDIQHRLIRVHERLPVAKAGHLVLLYPEWLPGNHAPRGPIDQLSGLTITAGGKTLSWRRDPLEVYAFHVDVPAATDELDIRFDVATPVTNSEGRVVFTPSILNLQWNQAVLYPAGHYISAIGVQASVHLPQGWKAMSALPVAAEGETVRYAPATLEVLADSPLFAGANTGALDLTPGAKVPVRANLFAEDKADLAATTEQATYLRNLVREAYTALGPPHFDHYDFLLALSDSLGGIGLEHHRSTEITLGPSWFKSWDDNIGRREVIAHEFTHSWNGKYRRPADLWTPDLNVPMQDSLLWVYEGMTQYYGMVLTARAGLEPIDFSRENFAVVAATYEAKRPGRHWRPLVDTTHQPIVTARRPLSWVSWQRTEDYYSESSLLWLGVDARIRAATAGAKGLDAVANAFFAAPPTQGLVSTYKFADVVKALNDVLPGDWQGYLDARVNQVDAPLDGITQAGLKLVYDDKPNAVIKAGEKERKNTDLGFGLGIVVNKDGVLTEVVWESPAFQAGLVNGMSIVAINGRGFTSELLKDAVTAAKGGEQPIELIVKQGDRYRTLKIDYRGGLRYPHLEPIAGATDQLATILKARAAAPAVQ
jgi:predicted metalloprotease with PDZ domain